MSVGSLGYDDILQFGTVGVTCQEHICDDFQGILFFKLEDLLVGIAFSKLGLPFIDFISKQEESQDSAAEVRRRHLYKLCEREITGKVGVSTKSNTPERLFEYQKQLHSVGLYLVGKEQPLRLREPRYLDVAACCERDTPHHFVADIPLFVGQNFHQWPVVVYFNYGL